MLNALPTLVAVLLAVTDIGAAARARGRRSSRRCWPTARCSPSPRWRSCCRCSCRSRSRWSPATRSRARRRPARCATCWSARSGAPGCWWPSWSRCSPSCWSRCCPWPWSGFVVGRLLLGHQPLSQAIVSVSGTSPHPGQIAGRDRAGDRLRRLLDARRRGDRAVLLSTLTDSPAGREPRRAGVADRVLAAADARRRAARCSPYLPTRYWLSFVDLFRDPILWRDVERGRRPAGGLRRGAARRGLGQLRHQGHHELSRRAVGAAELLRGPGAELGADHALHERVGGQAEWRTLEPGQTLCTVRFSAPARRAESGGRTTSSCVVQIETTRGPSCGFSWSRAPSRGLAGAAAGRRPGTRRRTACPARRSRCRGAASPSVTSRRVCARAAEVLDPVAGHDPAGGVADHVHRGRAGAGRVPRSLPQRACGPGRAGRPGRGPAAVRR